jgi:hypothetical protein
MEKDHDMESVDAVEYESEEEEEGLMGKFVGQKIRFKIDGDYHDGKVLSFNTHGLYNVEWKLDDDETVVKEEEFGWPPCMVAQNLA